VGFSKTFTCEIGVLVTSEIWLLFSEFKSRFSYVLSKVFNNIGFWSSVLFLLFHHITVEVLENRMPWEGEVMTCKMTINSVWQSFEAPDPLCDLLSLTRLAPQISYPGDLELKCYSADLIIKSYYQAAALWVKQKICIYMHGGISQLKDYSFISQGITNLFW